MESQRRRSTLVRKRASIYVAVGLIFSFYPSSLFAETPAPDGVDVAIVACSRDAVSDTPLAGIIAFAASLQLDRRGFRSVVLDRAGEAALRDPAAVLGEAEALGAGYLLLAETAEKDANLTLRLAWFDGGAGSWNAEVTRSGPEDMLMDEMIFGALAALLERADAAEPLRSKASFPRGASGASETLPAPSGAAAARSEATGSAPAELQSPLAAFDPERDETPRYPNRFEAGLDAGPFLAGGALGAFFETAGAVDARIAWYFPGREAAFGLGLSAAGLAFSAQGPLESATGILAPLALDLRLRAVEGRFRPFAHASGGVALLYLRTELYGGRAAVLPFAGAGLGIMRVAESGVGLSIDLSYSVFVDGEDLIMGFKPALEIALPLGKRP